MGLETGGSQGLALAWLHSPPHQSSHELLLGLPLHQASSQPALSGTSTAASGSGPAGTSAPLQAAHGPWALYI